MNARASFDAPHVREFLNRLANVRDVGADKWEASCPGPNHGNGDRRPSLSIGIGSDDRLLLNCHGGCSAADIVARMGLEMKDLFPPRRPDYQSLRTTTKPETAKKTGKVHATVELAMAAARWGVAQGRKMDQGAVTEGGRWDYLWRDGSLALIVVRFDVDDGTKEFRPIHPADGGYRLGDPDGLLPLYGLPGLDTAGTIYVVEGEKCADAARAIGINATTSAHGAKSPQKTDWTPLAGRDVAIIPDHDAAGDSYAAKVQTILAELDPPATVRIVNLPDLNDGDDIVEFIEYRRQGGIEDDDFIAHEIRELAKSGPAAEFKGSTGTSKAQGRNPKPRIDTDVLLTQQWNAQLLVERFGKAMRFDTAAGRWLVYDKTRWVPDATGVVNRMAKITARGILKFAAEDVDPAAIYRHWKETEKAAGIAAMMRLAESETGIPVTPDQLDADPWLFNTAAGTIDLLASRGAGQLRPHAPADLITKLSPVAYDPAADCPLWRSVLNRIMAGNGDLVGYLQRVAGLCLTGDIRLQELYVLHGGGANGKSVYVDTVFNILGPYAIPAPDSLLTMQSHNEHATEIFNLLGARAVVASETEEGARLKVNRVKQLTGDTMLTGRAMRQDYVTFRRTHKLLMVTNHPPRITDTGNAIWRRIRLIPFSVTIPPDEQDPNLLDKLKLEAPGILRWMVDGCLAWQREGMNPPTEVTLATESYRADSDPLADYLADRCVRGGENVKVSRGDLYADYQSWAHQVGEKFPFDAKAFYNAIRRVAGVVDGQWKPIGTNMPVRGFKGIGLTHSVAGYGKEGGSNG